MDPSSCRGQILTELIWVMLLVVGFTVFISKVYQGAIKAHQSPRWEIEKGNVK